MEGQNVQTLNELNRFDEFKKFSVIINKTKHNFSEMLKDVKRIDKRLTNYLKKLRRNKLTEAKTSKKAKRPTVVNNLKRTVQTMRSKYGLILAFRLEKLGTVRHPSFLKFVNLSEVLSFVEEPLYEEELNTFDHIFFFKRRFSQFEELLNQIAWLNFWGVVDYNFEKSYGENLKDCLTWFRNGEEVDQIKLTDEILTAMERAWEAVQLFNPYEDGARQIQGVPLAMNDLSVLYEWFLTRSPSIIMFSDFAENCEYLLTLINTDREPENVHNINFKFISF